MPVPSSAAPVVGGGSTARCLCGASLGEWFLPDSRSAMTTCPTCGGRVRLYRRDLRLITLPPTKGETFAPPFDLPLATLREGVEAQVEAWEVEIRLLERRIEDAQDLLRRRTDAASAKSEAAKPAMQKTLAAEAAELKARRAAAAADVNAEALLWKTTADSITALVRGRLKRGRLTQDEADAMLAQLGLGGEARVRFVAKQLGAAAEELLP